MAKILEIANIVSAEWLNIHLKDDDIIVLNATISKVIGDSSALNNKQIPNTQFFDIKKKFSDVNAPFPNTIPNTEIFTRGAQNLGINNDSVVIIYDDHGIYSSARAWWLLKTFGLKNVAILDGGLPHWISKGYPIEKKNAQKLKQKSIGNFKANYNPSNVVYIDSIEAIAKDSNFKIVDARSSDRFNCVVAEPRIGLRSGTIPSSINLPFNQVLDGNKLKSEKELHTIFNQLANPNQHLVFTCGSGITAAVLALAATVAGYKNSVYDGSWTEYGTLKIT